MAAGLAEDVLALLREVGEALTYAQDSSGTYDPSTRSYSGGSTSTLSVTGAPVPFRERELEGSSLSRGDLQGVLAATEFVAAGITPRTGDRITFQGTAYHVTPLETVRVAGEPVAYLVQMRGIQ